MPTSKLTQVKASDPGLLSGYLQISEDTGKTWNKRWFTLRDDFVMYSFRARQVCEKQCYCIIRNYVR